jgi:hypothetical protein
MLRDFRPDREGSIPPFFTNALAAQIAGYDGGLAVERTQQGRIKDGPHGPWFCKQQDEARSNDCNMLKSIDRAYRPEK